MCPFNSLGTPPGSRNIIQWSLAAAGTQPGSKAPAESCSKLNQVFHAGLRATNYFKREGHSLSPSPTSLSSFNGSSVENRERPFLSTCWEPAFLSPAHQSAPTRCHDILFPKDPLSCLQDVGQLKGTAEAFPAPFVSASLSLQLGFSKQSRWGWDRKHGGSRECFQGVLLNPALGQAGGKSL